MGREELTHADKMEVVTRYRQLHAAGVIHGDVGQRHWRRAEDDDRLLIIDFGLALGREDVDDFEMAARDEMWQVEFLLGMSGS